MLDAFIIEEIKRRDRGQGREDRPVVELPLPQPGPPPPGSDDDGPDPGDGDGGVIIIDYAS
jgi:hypothetical protein